MPPTKKHIYVQIKPPPADGCNWKFSQICSQMGKYSVFCSYRNKHFENLLFFANYIRANLCKFMSSPFSPRQPNTHECASANKTKFSDAHPKISKCHQNLSKLRVILPNVQTRNPQNQQSQTNRKMPKTIFCPFQLDNVIAPNPLKTLFIVPKWKNEVDNLLTVRWTSY